MGVFALDLTCLRPPIQWWSCHSRVPIQGEIFWVWKSDLHPCPDTRPFLPSGCVKKPLQGTGGWALYCQVWAHTQHKQHRSQGRITPCYPRALAHTMPSTLPVCLLTGDHMQAGFPWKNCTFQSYVLPSTPLPVFLPMHSVWKMGRWWQCSVGKMLWTIVTGIFKELLFHGCCYNTAKWSFLKGFPTEGSVEGIHKGQKHFLCVSLVNCWQRNVLCPSEVFCTCGCVEGKK